MEKSQEHAHDTIDIAADLNAEDETGLVWTFLDEAPAPDAIAPGAVVVAGSRLTPVVCEVIELVEKAVGTVVHLRVRDGYTAGSRCPPRPRGMMEGARDAERVR